MAFGDALGAPTEFLDVAEILRRYPPNGPQAPEGDPARVTDDTQMALAVAKALLDAPRPLTAAGLEPKLQRRFVEWYLSPENDRAPGNTCLQACERLELGIPWIEATVRGSKGCGANMRVAPVGLLPPDEPGMSEATRSGVAQLQAAMTHGHPTALVASDLTATAVASLVSGISPADLLTYLRDYAERQRRTYHGNWLGDLWQVPGATTAEDFIERGWAECLIALDRLDAALAHPDRAADPCLATGEGWVAEEALTTGLLCFLLFSDDGVAAIRRAAFSSGDSDSIACLTGAFAGAALGIEAWPAEWIDRIEYQERLGASGAIWDSVS